MNQKPAICLKTVVQFRCTLISLHSTTVSTGAFSSVVVFDISMGTSGQGERVDPVRAAQGACVTVHPLVSCFI